MRKATVGLIGVAVVLGIIGLAVIERPVRAPATAAPPPTPVAQPAPEPIAPTSPPAEKSVTVNGVELAAPSLSSEQRTKALGILADLRALHLECSAMPRKDRASLPKCGELMRANQPRAQALDEACADLPSQLKLTLGVAATRLGTGCSCLTPDAEESLALVTKSLDEAAVILGQ